MLTTSVDFSLIRETTLALLPRPTRHRRCPRRLSTLWQPVTRRRSKRVLSIITTRCLAFMNSCIDRAGLLYCICRRVLLPKLLFFYFFLLKVGRAPFTIPSHLDRRFRSGRRPAEKYFCLFFINTRGSLGWEMNRLFFSFPTSFVLSVFISKVCMHAPTCLPATYCCWLVAGDW